MSPKIPSTAALRTLRSAGIRFRTHRYSYQEHGGAQVAADALGVPLHQVIKTIVLEDEHGQPMLVLMHGDRQISTKKLARLLGVKRLTPCAPETARRTTGYRVGGTSPLGTRTALPVYAEASIAALQILYINGGARGLMVEIESRALLEVLRSKSVSVAIPLSASASAAHACR